MRTWCEKGRKRTTRGKDGPTKSGLRQCFVGPLAGEAGASCGVKRSRQLCSSRATAAAHVGEHQAGRGGCFATSGSCGIATGAISSGTGDLLEDGLAQELSSAMSIGSVTASRISLLKRIFRHLLMSRRAPALFGSCRF